MILGIGNDLCNIARVESALARHGARFMDHVLSQEEQTQVRARPEKGRAALIAKRFAAKEACAKALGTGIADGVYLRDLKLVNDPNGKPRLCLSGGALDRLNAMVPAGMVAQLDVSVSDDYPMAMAMVVISAKPGA